jgi:hypothetical protein
MLGLVDEVDANVVVDRGDENGFSRAVCGEAQFMVQPSLGEFALVTVHETRQLQRRLECPVAGGTLGGGVLPC